MTLGKDDLIAALRLRYDYYSAGTVFDLARERAGLADKPTFDAGELRAFRGALEAVGDRVTEVLAQLDAWLGSGPAPRESSADDPPARTPKVGDNAMRDAADDKPTRASKADDRSSREADTDDKAPRAHDADDQSGRVAKADDKSGRATKADDKSSRDTESDDKSTRARSGRKGTASDAKDDRASKSGPNAAAVETTIVLTGVPAADGDQVLVCGGATDLGDWEPERARSMSRKGDTWQTTVQLAPDAEVPFKFLRRTADGKLIWEGGDDRRLVAKPRVELTWHAG